MSVKNILYAGSPYSVYETMHTVLGDFLPQFSIHPDNDPQYARYHATSGLLEISFSLYIEHPRGNRRAELGFAPNIYIVSDLGDFMESLRLNFVNRVHADPDWNIALLQLDGYVDLLKVGTDIRLNTEYGFWTAERLSQVQFPYTFDKLETQL